MQKTVPRNSTTSALDSWKELFRPKYTFELEHREVNAAESERYVACHCPI
ncbi:unnamed protein product, partial [marine sediment metagenome]